MDVLRPTLNELKSVCDNLKELQEIVGSLFVMVEENRIRLVKIESHQKSSISNPTEDDLKNIKLMLTNLENRLIRLEEELLRKSNNEE
jgi:hypothetical protein